MPSFGRRTVYRGRTVRIDFKPDRKGIAAMAIGPEVTALVVQVAEQKALPYAISISPVGRAADGDQHPGQYRSSWAVEIARVVAGPEGYPMLRAAGVLINRAKHATHVELGTSRTKGIGHHVLRRTLEYLDATSAGD